MRSLLLKNTLTNYLSVGVRLLQGIFVTRWLVTYLGDSLYGLWGLLWSVFAYSLLLDFGFGMAVQKFTACRPAADGKDEHYNTVVSAIFSFYLCMAVIIAAGAYGASFFLESLLRVSDPEKLAYCRRCFLVFGFGTALTFPTGIFAEILVGLKRFYWRNYLMIIARSIEIAATLTIFKLGGSLLAITILSITAALIPNLLMLIPVRRAIPGFRLRFSLNREVYREVSNFSAYAYGCSLARLVLNKSSRMIVSIFLGLEKTGIFHLASRLGDLCFSFGSQYQENVRPVTAELHRRGKRRVLGRFIINSLRLNCFMGLALMLPAAIFTREALAVLFHATNPETVELTRWFLLSMFVSLSIRQIPAAYLMMAGLHKWQTIILAAEAVLNLTFDLYTVPRYGMHWVLYNSTGISLLLALTAVYPLLVRQLQISPWKLFVRVFAVPFCCALPGAAAALGYQWWSRQHFSPFFSVAPGSIICTGLFMALVYGVWLTPRERREGLLKILRRKGR